MWIIRNVRDDLVFAIDGVTATAAQPLSLTAASLLERTHLQQWVLAHPEILGVQAKIVTFEFGNWTARGAVAPADRLDVLAVDRAGRLILAELKRDRAPDTTTMQAINYAAMVSRFNFDTLADAHARHVGNGTSREVARRLLREWAPNISDATLNPIRIVLLAGEFSRTVTNTALFLRRSNLDIHLRRYQLFETPKGERILSISQVVPLPDPAELIVEPRSRSSLETGKVRPGRRPSVPARLVASNALQDGAALTIEPPAAVQEDRQAIATWLGGHPERARARWRRDAHYPVTWARDNGVYDLNQLIRIVIMSATGNAPRGSISGQAWLKDESGQTLQQLADGLP